MANCNECLHGDVCERFTDNVAIICKRFKHDNDYAEVKHGEWISRPSRLGDTFLIYSCSVCDRSFTFRPDYDYCPNCGAKMDLKEGAEE